MHILVLALTVIINLILQTTVIQALSINQVTFNLFIITICSFALLRGQRDGMLIGFALGFLQDLFFGQVLGLYALLYMVVGLCVGYFARIFYKESVIIPVSAIIVSDFLLNFMIFFLTLLFRGKTSLAYYMANIILPEVTYTALVSLLVYRIYLYTNNVLERYDKWRGTREKL